jgi:hypothetical protein
MRIAISILTAVLVTACAPAARSTTAEASPSSTPLATSSNAPDATNPPSRGTPGDRTVAPTLAASSDAAPRPSGLQRWSFARVAIPELNVREKPSTSARVRDRCCPGDDGTWAPLRYGTESAIDDLFILDGPVMSDGYRWWRIAPTEYVIDVDADGVSITVPDPIAGEEDFGWVADGDGHDSWLVPAESPCPPPPVETAEVTGKATSWAVTLSCFGDEILTFRGWYAVDEGWDFVSPAIFPIERHWADPENHDRLSFRLFPIDLPLPTESGWIDITGQFDHTSSLSCESWEVIECRSTFTATAIQLVRP